MNIFLNGKATDLPGDLTIEELVAQRGFCSATIIIQYNDNLVEKEKWNEIVIKENDRLEILRFVAGG